jgi:ATP synthase I chain
MTDEVNNSRTNSNENQTIPPEHPLALLTDEAAAAVLTKALQWTLVLAAIGALALWIGSGWRNAAVFAVGGVISAASIFEWQRLMRLFNAKMDQKRAPGGAALVVTFFLLRLLFFAAAIYVSLKWIDGSAMALLVGLSLAVITLSWQALRLLRG